VSTDEQDHPFILGVNYWPRRKAMYWWSDFDAGEVQEEFEIIASLGIGLVRPNGSLKPHAEVIRRFTATQPRVRPAQRAVSLDVSPDSYYQDPLAHARRLYQAFLEGNR
jgi:hypothetical protein